MGKTDDQDKIERRGLPNPPPIERRSKGTEVPRRDPPPIQHPPKPAPKK